MSQQPCLPVGHRRRKRQNGEAEPHDPPPPNWEQEDISSMDATEYLQHVVSEARRLPNVFVAPALTTPCNQFADGEEEEEEEELDEQMGGEETKTPAPLVANPDSNRAVAAATDRSSPAIKQTPTSSSGSNNNKMKKMRTSSQSFLSGSAAALEYLISKHTEMLPPPTQHHVPVAGKLWADRTLDAFSRLRLYLEQIKDAQGGVVEKKIVLPPMKDRAGWHVFCVGKQDAEGNAGAYFGDDDDDENDTALKRTEDGETDDEEKESAVPAWRRGLPVEEGYYWPTTSLLLQMDQVMVRRVLSHLTHFVCEGWSLTPARAAWLYALATRLARPVHRDDAVVIYKLLKRLTVIRTELMPPETSSSTTAVSAPPSSSSSFHQDMGRVNTLILIFAVYFEQGGGYATTMETATSTNT